MHQNRGIQGMTIIFVSKLESYRQVMLIELLLKLLSNSRLMQPIFLNSGIKI